ncbi:MAG: hypothetical protein GX434_07715 [Peptococcaceae bacterium]|nr:hypothetical protein [Peptococcaceae bacterium]
MKLILLYLIRILFTIGFTDSISYETIIGIKFSNEKRKKPGKASRSKFIFHKGKGLEDRVIVMYKA